MENTKALSENFSMVSNSLSANLSAIDNKIVVKEKKEKNKNKTYITGISAINLNTKKEAEEFAKKLKIKFGCGGKVDKEEESEKLLIVFQGNHRDKICKYIRENYPTVPTS